MQRRQHDDPDRRSQPGQPFAAINGSVLIAGTSIADGIDTHDASRVVITSGVISGGIFAFDDSTVVFDGGVILDGGTDSVYVYNNARFIWQGGTITSNPPLHSPLPPGGQPSQIYLSDNATLEVDGINLTAALINSNSDNGMYSEYQVSGHFGDGSSIPGGVNFYLLNPSASVLPPVIQLVGTPQLWSATGAGSWGNAANWSPAIVADGPGAYADLSAATGTITLDGNRTVGTLNMLGSVPFSVVPGTGGSLILNNNGSTVIAIIQGQQRIAAPVIAQDDTVINIPFDSSTYANDFSLTLADGITIATGKTLTKQDVGTLSTAFLRGGQLNINEGSVLILPNGTSAGASRIEGLNVAVSNGAVLDLANNALIISNTTIDDVMPLIQAGFSGGTWAGQGILSSTAAADPNLLTALGVIQNSIDGSPTGSVLYPTFEGFTSVNTDVLIKYTYFGDANLDGKVDGSDYSRIDSGFLTQTTGWYNGDFNYDGVVDGSDYTLIDNAFNSQSLSLAAEVAHPAAVAVSISSVPEPAWIGAMAMLAGLLTRRSRIESEAEKLAS